MSSAAPAGGDAAVRVPQTLTLDDGTVLSKVCLDGHGSAESAVLLPDGARYSGPLKLFRRHGLGTLSLPGGKAYAGRFVDGCRDGFVSTRKKLR